MYFAPQLAVVTVASIALLLVAPAAHARKPKKDSLAGKIAGEVSRKFDEATTPAPIDDEVCFSPDEGCDIKLAKFIDSATTSIDVAIFDVTLDQVVHKLLVQSRKIPVRVVLDRRQSKGRHSLFKTLRNGVTPDSRQGPGSLKVRIGRQRGIMHNKFTIIDGKRVETGSFNYSKNATEANQENQVYLGKPEIVARYKERFEKIWSTAKEPDAKLRNGEEE